MLAYLDALIAALAARDIAETERLLAHPLARILSPEALADATAERRAAVTDQPAGNPAAPPPAPLSHRAALERGRRQRRFTGA